MIYVLLQISTPITDKNIIFEKHNNKTISLKFENFILFKNEFVTPPLKSLRPFLSLKENNSLCP